MCGARQIADISGKSSHAAFSTAYAYFGRPLENTWFGMNGGSTMATAWSLLRIIEPSVASNTEAGNDHLQTNRITGFVFLKPIAIRCPSKRRGGCLLQ
jgi:hypothetical protein